MEKQKTPVQMVIDLLEGRKNILVNAPGFFMREIAEIEKLIPEIESIRDNGEKEYEQLHFAIQQFIGFNEGFLTSDIIALAAGMGLKKQEWEAVKDDSGLMDRHVHELNEYYDEK